MVADVLQHRGDPAVPGLAVEHHIELVEQGGEPAGIPGFERRGAITDDAVQRGQVLGRDADRRLPGALSFQQLTNLVDLPEVLLAVPGHHRAAGQFGLAQHVPGWQGGGDDLLPELQVHGVLELTMLDWLAQHAGHAEPP